MLYNELQIKGLSTELECEKKFIELGFIVSVPYGNNARYDFLVDTGKRFFRMQAKTSKKLNNNNSYSIATSNNVSTMKGVKRKIYTKEDIDFIVSIIEEELLIIPVEEISSPHGIVFRKDLTKNKQIKNIHYIMDYSLNKKFLSILHPDELPEIFNPIKNTNTTTQNNCPICGKLKSKFTKFCEQCTQQKAIERISNIVTKEELKELIRKESFKKIGQHFNVSARTISIWCQNYNLPYTKKEINSYTDTEWEQL